MKLGKHLLSINQHRNLDDFLWNFVNSFSSGQIYYKISSMVFSPIKTRLQYETR